MISGALERPGAFLAFDEQLATEQKSAAGPLTGEYGQDKQRYVHPEDVAVGASGGSVKSERILGGMTKIPVVLASQKFFVRLRKKAAR